MDQKIQSWKALEPRFWWIFAGWGIFIFFLSGLFLPLQYLTFVLLGILVFAIEFKLLAWLLSVLIRQVKADPTKLFLVIFAKIFSWVFLLSAPYWLPEGAGFAFGIGAAVFLVALFHFSILVGSFANLGKKGK